MAALTMLGGCIGFGRDHPRVLFPADSLSRTLAESLPVDTLRVVRHVDTPGAEEEWELVGTVQFDPEGRLWAGDVAAGRLYVLDPEDGALEETIEDSSFAYPYLAGRRGDTLGVMNAGTATFDELVDGRVATRRNLPARPTGDALSFYALLTEGGLFFKDNPDPGTTTVARLGPDGSVSSPVVELPGPPWRHRGILRAWGDTVLSLSAYRPVVDLLLPGGTVDTLALQGFDSPVLPQSRLYALGESDEAPTMITSAAPVGDLLFVLNVRPGWTRIDVYGRDGRIRHILVEENPGVSGFNDLDLDVRPDGAGGYLIAVARVKQDVFWLSAEYVPRVTIYRWVPPPA